MDAINALAPGKVNINPVSDNVSALNIHFESQCIPTLLAWYAHHLPTWFLRFTTVIVNIFELVIPFLFFFPNRKVRIVAFYTQVNMSN